MLVGKLVRFDLEEWCYFLGMYIHRSKAGNEQFVSIEGRTICKGQWR